MSDRKVIGAGHHVAALDGLRGVAAFAVMLTHFSTSFGLDLIPKAYLAVDFFFVLSGYVLALAYEERLRRKGSFLPFLKARLIRLYPLIPVGMVFGFAAFFARNFLARDKGVDPATLVEVLAVSLLLLPLGRLPNVNENHDFPFNPPIWSLMFELIVNAVYGLVAPWLKNAVLAVLLAACAAAVVAICQIHGSFDLGEQKGFFEVGLLRVTVSFFAGVALWRLQQAGRLRLRTLPFWPIALTLLLAFLPSRDLAPALYDAVCILVLFPLIVAVSLAAELKPGESRFALWLGRLSYPLYVLHFPFMFVSTYLSNRFVLALPVRLAMLAGECAVAAVFALVVLRFYDEPLRARLSRRK